MDTGSLNMPGFIMHSLPTQMVMGAVVTAPLLNRMRIKLLFVARSARGHSMSKWARFQWVFSAA